MKKSKLVNSLIQIGTILLAALVVVGITYAVGQQANASGERGGERAGVERGGDHDDHGDHGDHDDHGFGGFRSIAGFARTIVPMTLIIGVFVGVQSFWGKSRKREDMPVDEGDDPVG